MESRPTKQRSISVFKTNHPERELDTYFIKKDIIKDVWIRFRLGISDLYVQTFQYNYMPYPTLCPLCDDDEEDERQFLLISPAVYEFEESTYSRTFRMKR